MTAHPHADDPASRELQRRLLPHLAGLLDVVVAFLADKPTPATTFAKERDIAVPAFLADNPHWFRLMSRTARVVSR